MLIHAIVTLLLASSLSASAQSKSDQFRMMQLADGRSLVVKIVSTEADGIHVSTPQGQMVVAFHELSHMEAATSDDFMHQPEWELHVSAADEAVVDQFIVLASEIPSVEVVRVGTATLAVSPEAAASALSCGQDLDCLAGALSPGVWLVRIDLRGDEIALVSTHTDTSNTRRATVAAGDREALWQASHTMMGVETSDPAPRPERAPELAHAVVPKQAPRSSDALVPLPGYPALRAGDGRRVGSAWAITVPLTALWVGAAGTQAQSAAEHVGLSLLGFYAITASVNRLLTPDGRAVVQAGPSEAGGAVVEVRVTR